MKTILIMCAFTISLSVFCHDYHHSDSLIPPKGLETVGATHGEIAIDSKGLVYLSVEGGEKSGIQVYDASGKYLHNIVGAPTDFHGFVIHEEDGVEYIYGSRLKGQSIIKMDLSGKVLLTINGSVIPDKYKKKKQLKLTSVVVGLNGDIYAVDGYGLDYIHRFDKTGKYLMTFGGRKAPYNLNNCHKIFIDSRFESERIICCDRKNGRLLHLDMEGKVIGTYAENLRRPSGVAFWGNLMVVAEIYGRLTLLNKEGKVLKIISDNEKIKGGNNWPVNVWEDGLVITPHGVCFDKFGNVLVSEFNKYGRILKYSLKK